MKDVVVRRHSPAPARLIMRCAISRMRAGWCDLMLLLLLLLVGVAAVNGASCGSSKAPDCRYRLHRKNLTAVDNNARCADQTDAIYYFNSERQAHNSKWMIFLEGGGVCGSAMACRERYRNMVNGVRFERPLVSSRTSAYNETLCGAGVFDDSDDRNPFRNFRQVVLPYCTQDMFLGSNVSALNTPFDATTANEPTGNVDPGFSFLGSLVYRAMIKDLVQEYNLSNATEIILAGSSAGALGVMNQVRWTQAQLNSSTVQVKLLLDSPWIINYRGIGQELLFTDYLRRSTNFLAHPACQVMHNELPCCVSPECMIENKAVGVPENIPVLILTSTYDLFMLQLAILATPGRARSTFIDLISDYGGAMNQSLNTARAQSHVSLIQTRCSQHTYLVSSSLWQMPQFCPRGARVVDVLGGKVRFEHFINQSVWKVYRQDPTGMNLQTLLGTWYSNHSSPAQSALRGRDRCPGFLCNTGCPDSLSLGKTGLTFPYTFRVVIIVLAVFFSAGAFVVKVALKVHLLMIDRSMKKFLSDTDLKLSDCLPESSNVSVACYNLTYRLTIPGTAIRPEEDLEESCAGEHDQFPPRYDNGSVADGKASRGIRRSASAPESPSAPHPANPKKTRRSASLHPGIRRETPAPEVKLVVNGVTAYFNSGSMVAIMGPSGCGKTTLMDLLTGRRVGDIKGEVLVNGHPLGAVHTWYHRNTGYVRQLATPYYDELTVRENLLYSALLRLPSNHTSEEIYEQMKMVTNEVGLSDIEDRVVGGSTGGGISGGEKRRLIIAMQLMGMPNILFLDEPTSGLDSTAAKDLLDALHIIAQGNRLVVLSIHQPRPEIYHLFAQILFLCKGQVAFYGTPDKAIKFFMQAVEDRNPESFEKLASEKYNPADLILDALNDEQNQTCILDQYKSSPEPGRIYKKVMSAKNECGTQSVFGSAQSRSFWHSLLSLEGRMKRQTWGQAMYLPLVFFFYGLGIGIAYYKAERGFLLLAAFNLLTNISFLFVSPALCNVILGRCLHIFEMEHGDGVMRVSHLVLHAFLHMTAITLIPFAILTALIFYMVSTVGTPQDFLLVLLLNITANGTDVAIVILICVTIPSYATPIAHVVCAYVTFFEGFLYPVPDIHTAIRWLIYGNPNYYAFSAEMRILLEGRSLACNQAPIHCTREDGNTILSEFGFTDADPYLAMLIMMLMTGMYLILAMLALLPKGYIKNYFRLRFGHLLEKDDNDTSSVERPFSNLDEQDERRPLVDIVHGPLVHTSDIWTTMKRGATQANLNRPNVIPVSEYNKNDDPKQRPRLASGGKAGLVKRQKSLAVVRSSQVNNRSPDPPKMPSRGASFWRSRFLPQKALPVQIVSEDEPARHAAMQWLYLTRLRKGIRSEAPGSSERTSAATRLLESSLIKWSQTVQEKQLCERREQSKRQLDGGRRLVEQSLDHLLNQVRGRTSSNATASPMTESARQAQGNWNRLTHRIVTDDGADGGSDDSTQQPASKPRRVQIAEMPMIREDSAGAGSLASLDHSPRVRTRTAPSSLLTESPGSLSPLGSSARGPLIPALSNAARSSSLSSAGSTGSATKPAKPLTLPVLSAEPRKHQGRYQRAQSYHQMVHETVVEGSEDQEANTKETPC